jgi:hypothetical protein
MSNLSHSSKKHRELKRAQELSSNISMVNISKQEGGSYTK